MNTINKLESCSIILGSAVGLAQIQSILGIVILVFQIILIVYKLIFNLYTKIKDKKYDEIGQDVQQGIDEINALKDTIEKKETNDDR